MTEEQIQAEIKILKEIVDKVPEGIDGGNRIQIRAQIRVLDEDMDDNEIDSEWPNMNNREDHFSNSGALDAREWLDDEWDAEDHGDCASLSEEWKALIK